ncbi:hypothetical protein GCM10027053_49110 [Intrasporangium mesophilum]
MRPFTVGDLAVGTRVLYNGPEESGDVLDERRRAEGRVLIEHHPGTIRVAAEPQHVLVDFLGLEDEPVSWAVGFGYDETTGLYPGLLIPDDADWEAAVRSGWWRTERCG